MITRQLVLVLGAGASMPYGFPSGRALVRDAVSDWAREYLLQNLGYPEQDLDDFGQELRLSGQPSVDAFLELRPEFMEIGKAVIAFCLLRLEHIGTLFEDPPKACEQAKSRWYPYLFEQLGTSRKSFRENKVSIVTFNYDRSLEYYLWTAIRHSYNLSEADAALELGALNIIHVYGGLGTPHFLSSDGRAYDNRLTRENVEAAAKGIRIISEERQVGQAFATAHALLGAAETVCFLGFGYHDANVQRLGISPRGDEKRVFLGSTHGMGRDEIDRAERLFDPRVGRLFTLDRSNDDALEFLKEYPVFR